MKQDNKKESYAIFYICTICNSEVHIIRDDKENEDKSVEELRKNCPLICGECNIHFEYARELSKEEYYEEFGEIEED